MKLMILDGNSIVNRAFYGIRPLTTKDGLFTNAIYGFLNILDRMRSEEQPDALCVAFDLKAPTFRHRMYDGYKATRHGMPEELAQQMPVLKDVLTAMRIPQYTCEGWEADDLLGTVGRICSEQGHQCVIVTGDRDSLQLVDKNVTVKLVTSKAGQTLTTNYTPEVFQAEYGFAPRILIDLKSLMGDSSDNIPGVPGVGEKTAKALLAEFGTLERIYASIDSPEIREAVRKKLVAGEASARMSYDLATIRTNAPIDFAPEDCRVRGCDKQALYQLFLRLEFLRLIDRYNLREPDEPEQIAEPVQETCTSEIVTERARAEELLEAWRETGVTVLPLADLSGVACQTQAHMVIWLRNQLPDYDDFLRVLFGPELRKTAHGVKEWMHRLRAAGLPAENFEFDTEIAAYLLAPSDGSYALERLTPGYLGFDLKPVPDFRSDRPVNEQTQQLGAWMSRCAAISALRECFEPKLAQTELMHVFREIDLPLCSVLASMELAGVLIDREALLAWSEMLAEKTATCQKQIYEMAGLEFNINSPKQLGEVLFEKLGLPHGKKTSRGYATNVDVLEKLAPTAPIARAILEYRTYAKMKSTYADGLLQTIAADGRIHTTFQNTVTATGRLSSTEPNLQNIPVRTELGSEIRRMFVPAPGCVLVDADYSQIELRVLAHIADDPLMQEAFRSGEDIHRVTASQVFGVPLSDVTSEMRRSAKAVNFGIVYGISEFSLAEDIGVSRYEAKAYIEGYLEKYAGVRAYMHDIVEQARREGYVSTMFGRRRALPEIKSTNFNVRAANERIAMNTPIQGTAADIIKLAMVAVDHAIREAGLQARLVLQIHDELIVECPESEAETVKALLEREMEHVVSLRVPLIAEAKMGKSWYETK